MYLFQFVDIVGNFREMFLHAPTRATFELTERTILYKYPFMEFLNFEKYCSTPYSVQFSSMDRYIS